MYLIIYLIRTYYNTYPHLNPIVFYFHNMIIIT
jgi:hypothetical protein